jgi:hypothetical protein
MTFEDEDFIPYNGSSPVNVACALIASRKLNADPVAIATRKKSAVERMLVTIPSLFYRPPHYSNDITPIFGLAWAPVAGQVPLQPYSGGSVF